MSWAKLDDRAYTHPKFLGLDPAAIALWVFGLSYVANVESDGFIPRPQVPILAAVFNVSPARAFRLATELVGRGLWDELGPEGYQTTKKLGPGFWIHDYLVHNFSREQLKDRRTKEAEKKGKQRERPQGTPEGSPAAPDPTRPVPTQESKATAGADASLEAQKPEAPKPDSNDLDLLTQQHRTLFEGLYSVPPPAVSVAATKSLGRVLEQRGLKESLDLMRAFFKTEDKWIVSTGHKIEVFEKSITTLIRERAKRQGSVLDPGQRPEGGGALAICPKCRRAVTVGRPCPRCFPEGGGWIR